MNPRRYGAIDVDYPETGGARGALVLAGEPAFRTLVDERVTWLDEVAPYEPGAFYKRELPAVHALLDPLPPLELLIVDGYVDLDPAGRPGLGAHVHDELRIPVVGVAKTAFLSATHAVPVLRGGATRPLFVTAAGVPLAEAAAMVAAMAGGFRLPDALRRVDALARGRAVPSPAVEPSAG
ncbi:endonuclease V [Dactylosporangium sp. NPDC050688]|uniref:endonuclease V n=1 Tax=Dactylosporangium sp. NPDC050688 TaxID=3157217 RepID=UPI0033E37C30